MLTFWVNNNLDVFDTVAKFINRFLGKATVNRTMPAPQNHLCATNLIFGKTTHRLPWVPENAIIERETK